VFPQVRAGTRLRGMLEFELGHERSPSQLGGIHLTDTSRILVASIFRNSLELCLHRAALPIGKRRP
jgi:hypothetical protein